MDLNIRLRKHLNKKVLEIYRGSCKVKMKEKTNNQLKIRSLFGLQMILKKKNSKEVSHRMS